MTEPTSSTFNCPICQQQKTTEMGNPVELLHEEIAQALAERLPGLAAETMICDTCLEGLRGDYFEDVLEEEVGELDELEREVVQALEGQELITENINEEFEEHLTFGQRLADKVAAIGGSWAFIIFFAVALIVWMWLNAILAKRAFDPYPYILLNLCLSTVAALQAPVIMMSQNRQSAKDRLRAEQDYQINLKAELQTRHIYDMLDYLMTKQWQRMLEIQHSQTELIEELADVTRRFPGVYRSDLANPQPPPGQAERRRQP
jgi:uncharacterized membrane protein